MYSTFEQTSSFLHQFTCKQKTTSDAVSTCIFLRFGKLNKGLGSRMFDKQFGDNFRSIVRDGVFTICFVHHFVQPIWTKGSSKNIAKCNRSPYEFLCDSNTTGYRGGWPNNDNRRTTRTIVLLRHASAEQPFFKNSPSQRRRPFLVFLERPCCS